MSPDDILAANLWPWPDPLLKRDRAGNILFVNAAFLQLYGGRVEDWCGRALNGWPAPTTQGAQRFETRAGEGTNETVYDWVETVMADGNTMAIARNVTALIAAAIASVPQNTPVIEPAPVVAPQQAQELTPVAPIQAPIPAAQVEPTAPVAPALTSEFEETLNNDADDYSYNNSAETNGQLDTAPIPEPLLAPQPSQAITPPPVSTAPPEEPRMIERRALPIEDSSSVLGSNWRDQVIAKAIGSELVGSENTQAAPIPTPEIEAPVEEEDNNTGVGKGMHILLAEDNAINALLTRTLLEAEGATVETVEDGALAVDAVKTGNYDLVFMDMRMPNMDGLESTRKIRALGKTMPIIALTANAFDDDRNSCFDSGMNDFMTKPVSAEELTEMVATWVRNGNEKKMAS